MLLLAVLPAGLGHAEGSADTVYVFRNGDRIHGQVIGREEGVLLVRTAHFGVQRISIADLESPNLIPVTDTGSNPMDKSSSARVAPGLSASAAPASGWHAALERLRRPLRFWHVGLNIALEAKQEDIQRSSILVELKATHEFAADEVHGTASYERVHEDEKLTTDLAKAEFYWRHNLNPKWFTVYLSNMEWNRHYLFRDIPVKYLLAQQETGFGRTFLRNDRMKLRAGVAENFLNLWVLTPRGQASTTIESAFVESDLQLPFRMQLTERISYYYAIRNGEQGEKSEFELTKELSAHFKVRLRHEFRRNLPLSNVNNINLWRLVFGLEY